MLLGVILALSALAAVAAAVGSSLWPLALIGTFAGTFAGLTVLCVLIIWIMSLAVDMEREAEKDSPLYRCVTHLAIDFVIPLFGIRVRTQGLEKTPREGRFLLVCNHLNDVDPAFLLKYFKKNRLAFISKRENDRKLIIGPFLHKLLCQPINRENDREALKTILKCISILKEDKASIAVFPEGWVSLDRKLHPLRPGVFKIAQKAGVPIVVCTLRDTFTVLPNMRKLKPSEVELHLVDVLSAEVVKGMNTTEIAHKVHAMMAEDLGADNVLQAE